MNDDLRLPQDDKPKGGVSTARLAIWVIVGGVGIYLVASGVIGIISGGSGG